MTNGTIFQTLSIDRAKVQWESYLDDLTPVQQGASGMWYKREDWFAPLGYGGINGAKLRQCIWLLNRARREGYNGVISAGSVKSPQHAMVATLCRHYNMNSYHVVGATKPETAKKHDSIAIAQAMGAEFEYIKVGYNAALQSRVRQLMEVPTLLDGTVIDEWAPGDGRWYQLEYAISLDHKTRPVRDIKAFHDVGAVQISNIPDRLTDIIMPAGSCNSCCSVLWGLYHKGARPLTVHLIGIGHDRTGWLTERLARMGVSVRAAGSDGGYQRWLMTSHSGAEHTVYYYDLIGHEYTDYQQMWKESLDGIVGHPTYEAKCFRYLKECRPELIHDRALFWVVGSEPKLAPMMASLRGEEATVCDPADTVI
jgi:hypothetical protein